MQPSPAVGRPGLDRRPPRARRSASHASRRRDDGMVGGGEVEQQQHRLAGGCKGRGAGRAERADPPCRTCVPRAASRRLAPRRRQERAASRQLSPHARVVNC
eukprot:scaffold1195_cov358-Prasinococcus_capsulatus_cf.AAC.12